VITQADRDEALRLALLAQQQRGSGAVDVKSLADAALSTLGPGGVAALLAGDLKGAGALVLEQLVGKALAAGEAQSMKVLRDGLARFDAAHERMKKRPKKR
jgi:hypothetical protein